MIITGYYFYKGRYKESSFVCTVLPLLGIILLSLGMLALFLDLEYKVHVWRMYATFRITSPMSWGSWILILVYPVLFGSMLINPPGLLANRYKFINNWSDKVSGNVKLVKTLSVLNIITGSMLGIYTGILLSSFGARPLWNSPLISILFLVSGISTAAAFVHMISRNVIEKVQFAKVDNLMIALELVIIGLFIIGLLSSARAGIESVMLLINGNYAAVFWVMVVCLGLVIPLIIQSLAIAHKIKHTTIAPLLVLLGGLMLRFVIVYAGQFSHWTKTALLK
jgi:formate-dependent nitrite reductase membrane component NrfD